METVYLALSEHQAGAVGVLLTIVSFVAGWSVFGWTR